MVSKKTKKSVRKKVSRKKPVSKKKIKRKTVRRNSVKKTSNKSKSLSKKDFETFQFGVNRLKELKKELDSLNTTGFTKEEQAIRAKLKTVSEIPNIEIAIRKLKLKVNRKYKPKRRKGKNSIKEIHEDIEDVRKDLRNLKATRKDSVEDIKEQIKKLKTPKSRIPIDSNVDILVDTNFNDFLLSTKKALSDRIKNREEEMDKALKGDLEKRELKYRKKHSNLLRDFEDKKKKLEDDYKRKYNKKIESTLHSEVSKKFNKILNDKLSREKVQLAKTYKAKLKEEADLGLQKRKAAIEKQLRKQFSNKLKILQAKFHKKIMEENKKEESEMNVLEQKKTRLDEAKQRFELQKQAEVAKIRENLASEFHEKLIREIAKKEKFLRDKLSREYVLKLKKQVQEHEEQIKRRKLDLELEMQRKIKQILQ